MRRIPARGAGVHLELDDRVVQFAGELANLLIESLITGLVELVEHLRRLIEAALLQAFNQLRCIGLQSRFELRQALVCLRHSALAALLLQPLTRSKIFSIFSLSTWAVKGLTT